MLPDIPERWLRTTDFIARWHRPLAPDDGYDQAELDTLLAEVDFPVPAALQEWYLLAGWRADLINDHAYLSNGLYLRGGRLAMTICAEDDTAEWAIRLADLDQPDPPVVVGVEADMFAPDGLFPHSTSVSEFFYKMVIEEAIPVLGGPHAGGSVHGSIEEMADVLTPFPLLAATQEPRLSYKRYYGDADTLIRIRGKPTWLALTFVARTPVAFERVLALLSRPWTRLWSADKV